jgi:hypothetical protein
MDMAGAESVDDDEDIQINEITFQHFIDVTFQTQAKCMSVFYNYIFSCFYSYIYFQLNSRKTTRHC